jgi:alpha-tubulin suppressor-like RCC1 family protein
LVIPPGLTNVKAIAAGLDYNLALRSDGMVIQWGDTAAGQGGMPDGLDGVIAIASSSSSMQTLALRSDGTVVAWGVDSFLDGAFVPPGLINVKAIATGAYGFLALLSDGTVVQWEDQSSQVPPGLTGVVAIAAGSGENGGYYFALKSDGTIVAWGDDADHQTEVPSGLSNVLGISAGNIDSLALKSDGTVVAWGFPALGVTTPPANLVMWLVSLRDGISAWRLQPVPLRPSSQRPPA